MVVIYECYIHGHKKVVKYSYFLNGKHSSHYKKRGRNNCSNHFDPDFFSDFKKWSLTVSDFTKWGTFDRIFHGCQFVLTFAAMIYMVFNKFSAVVRTDVINI